MDSGDVSPSPSDTNPAASLVSFGELTTFPEEAEQFSPIAPLVPTDKQQGRPGIFQGGNFSATWLPPTGGTAEPRITELVTYATFGFPAPTRESPLLLTPGFETRFLDDDGTFDLPEEVYDAYLEVRWMRKLSPLWGLDLAVSPGVHSDFQPDSGDGFRLTGRALLSYDWSPASKFIFGAVYLDRDDVSVLPAAGWLWQPNPWTKVDLVFPRPRFARRIRCQGDIEDWCYLAGEFGGGAWGIERADGTGDQLYMRDYRLLLGAERKLASGLGGRFEIGYVFGRQFEYNSTGSTIDLDPTVLLRAAILF